MAFVFTSTGTQNYLMASTCVISFFPPPHLTLSTIFLTPKTLSTLHTTFFLPAVKFSSIQQIISKTCHEPNTVTGAFKGQYVWTPVPALQSSANDRQIKDH